jgi:hypothetical protein
MIKIFNHDRFTTIWQNLESAFFDFLGYFRLTQIKIREIREILLNQ